MLESINIYELLGGMALSLAIGALGHRRGALSASGVMGALITGTLIFGLGGWEWGTLLAAFFVSSSALSFYRAREKEALAEKFAKGHRRDLGQALANGGLAALLAVLSQLFRPPPSLPGAVRRVRFPTAWWARPSRPSTGARPAAKRPSASCTTAAPQGDIIDVATDDDDDEQDPAVALCASDEYLVVYENEADDEIYGQRLDSGGDLLGDAFQITDDSYRDAKPDVACGWDRDRFIVVWEHDSANSGDFDVRVQGVYGSHRTSGSQLYGNWHAVSQDAPQDELDPAIACNSFDHTCLVVFEYDDGTDNADIYGQRISVGSSDTAREGSRFAIGGFGANEYNSDVAWGGLEDNYLVVWQYWDGGDYRVLFSEVWDTDQSGSQIDRGGTYLTGDDTDQLFSAVAYSRDARDYLIAFQYDYYGNGSDYDIDSFRLDATDTNYGSRFAVAWTSDNETSPAVAFSGGPESLSGGMGADQFLVTYVYESDSEQAVYGQAVKGTHATSGGQLEGAPTRVRATGGGTNFGLFDPDVTGSFNSGRYLVVWEDMTGGFAGYDYDVLGRMVAPYAVYLPLVLNSHASDFGFQPNPDGYSFANYNNSSHYYQDDLGAGDLIHMFGANKVCASGSTPADCVLTAAAEAWRQKMFGWMNGGHCEGMAVTSLRFFKGQTYYTGDTTPGDFQAGAQKVYDLTRSQAIDNYIAYYFSL